MFPCPVIIVVRFGVMFILVISLSVTSGRWVFEGEIDSTYSIFVWSQLDWMIASAIHLQIDLTLQHCASVLPSLPSDWFPVRNSMKDSNHHQCWIINLAGNMCQFVYAGTDWENVTSESASSIHDQRVIEFVTREMAASDVECTRECRRWRRKRVS